MESGGGEGGGGEGGEGGEGKGGSDIKKKISLLNVSQLFAELFILWIRTQYY